MTLKEIVDAVTRLAVQGQQQWLIRLGFEFTIAARAGYPTREGPGNLHHLIGFNELQHQLYNYLHGTKPDWGMESLLNCLFDEAKRFRVEGDFGWALKSSLRGIISD